MKRSENSSNDFPTACTMGAQPQGKRIIVKSLIAKLLNKFNVSAAEIDEQDIHHTEGVPWEIIVIGVSAIVHHNAMADSLMEEISQSVEENT